jgi:predicted metalloprotease with PDZ domain
MIHYTLSCSQRLSQLLQVSMAFEQPVASPSLALHLPAWRPGRYEFQPYARNILQVKAYGPTDQRLTVEKSARNVWQIQQAPAGKIRVEYEYSCTQLDAGGSWIDDQLLYINPINCLLYLKERMEEACQFQLDVEGMQSLSPASSLLFRDGLAQTKNFYELADSPLFISTQQGHDEYLVGGTHFHIWTHGQVSYDKALLRQHFIDFTDAQVQAMGSFPVEAYHFLLILLPIQHYHGVEHQRSTVITLGPSQALNDVALYQELISISSHELYHAWNICNIRPQEMLPYRFEEENYFRTGFVAEGITSYLGEYFLRKSKFFSRKQFLYELQAWFLRHRKHRGLERASLSDSSFDLWVDGYIPSSSDYKVSIYVAGALAALALDLNIRLASPGKSIEDLMKSLYHDIAQQGKGYTESILRKGISTLIGEAACETFWNTCITGHDVDAYAMALLEEFGVAVKPVRSTLRHERLFGFTLKPTQKKPEVAKVHFDSPAAAQFMPDDLILSVDDVNISNATGLEEQLTGKTQAVFYVLRKGRELELEVSTDERRYWDQVLVEKNSEASDEQKLRYKDWLGNNA